MSNLVCIFFIAICYKSLFDYFFFNFIPKHFIVENSNFLFFQGLFYMKLVLDSWQELRVLNINMGWFRFFIDSYFKRKIQISSFDVFIYW